MICSPVGSKWATVLIVRSPPRYPQPLVTPGVVGIPETSFDSDRDVYSRGKFEELVQRSALGRTPVVLAMSTAIVREA